MSSRFRIALAGLIGSVAIGSAKGQACNVEGLRPADYQAVLKKQFASVASPKTNAVIGSFASYETNDKDNTVSFASTTALTDLFPARRIPVINRIPGLVKSIDALADRSLLGIKAHGGSADDRLPFLTGTTINKNVGADVQLHFLRKRGDTLMYDVKQLDSYCEGLKKASVEYQARLREIGDGYREVMLRGTHAAVEQKIAELKKEMADASKPAAARDTLQFAILRLERQRDSLKSEISQQAVDSVKKLYAAKDALAAHNARESALLDLRSKLTLEGFSFGWITVGYSIGNNTFRRFEPTAAFADQVTKTSFTSHGVSAGYSYYHLSPASHETFFFSAFAKGSIGDNFDDLDKVEVSETSEFGPTADARTVVTTYKAYKGAYERDLKAAAIDVDIYKFLTPGNTFAVHFYPGGQFREKATGTANLGLGILMSAKAKESTFVNAELFFNAVDLWNVKDAKGNLFERGNVGFRFTFPINFQPTL